MKYKEIIYIFQKSQVKNNVKCHCVYCGGWTLKKKLYRTNIIIQMFKCENALRYKEFIYCWI